MKKLIILLSLISIGIADYSRNDAVNYAKKNYNKPNHDCDSDYIFCTPYAYYGDEHCGFSSHGGNSANFVSQSLVIGGGHPKLRESRNCVGTPCGFEVPGVWEIGECLQEKGWISVCGYLMKPPSYIKSGDVIIYHRNSCEGEGHAALITTGGTNPKITCQSKEQIEQHYNYMSNSRPYYQWIHYND